MMPSMVGSTWWPEVTGKFHLHVTLIGDRDGTPLPERLQTMHSVVLLSSRGDPTRRRTWWPRLGSLIAAAAAITAMASCSDNDRSATRFCGSLNTALPDLTATVASSDDISALVDRFQNLNDITPIAIEDEWQALTDLVQLAADTDPLNPESRQTLADAAYRTERPAREIERWVEATCGFQMPDVIGLEGPYVP